MVIAVLKINNDGVYRAVECLDTTEDVPKRLGGLNSPQFGV